MGLFLFILVPYAIAFFALFLLRRALWLGIGAVIAVLVIVGLFRLMERSSGDAGMSAHLLLMSVALGFVSGAVGRLVLMAVSRGRELRPGTTKIVAVASFLVAPVFLWVVSQAMSVLLTPY